MHIMYPAAATAEVLIKVNRCAVPRPSAEEPKITIKERRIVLKNAIT